MHLHHNYSVHLHAPRTQYEYDLQIPLRKMVDCRTRDLHQSLLVKLNRALVRQGKSGSNGLEGARSLRAFSHHPALEGTGVCDTPHGAAFTFTQTKLKTSVPPILRSQPSSACLLSYCSDTASLRLVCQHYDLRDCLVSCLSVSPWGVIPINTKCAQLMCRGSAYHASATTTPAPGS